MVEGAAPRCTPESCHPFLHRLWYQDDLRRTWNDIVREPAEDDPRVRTIAIDDAICHDDAVPCDDPLPLPSSPGAGPTPAEAALPPGCVLAAPIRAPWAGYLPSVVSSRAPFVVSP